MRRQRRWTNARLILSGVISPTSACWRSRSWAPAAIGHLLSAPRRSPAEPMSGASSANFHYQAGSWSKPRRVVAKVEWHPGELYPRVGFIVTNMARPSPRMSSSFYNKRGTCEQWIKEGKGAIRWTRLSCRSFAGNAVSPSASRAGLQSRQFPAHAGDARADDWSLTSLREKLIKIGAKVVSHGRYVAFQMAEVAIPQKPLRRHSAAHRRIAAAGGHVDSVGRSSVPRLSKSTGDVCLVGGELDLLRLDAAPARASGSR